MLYQHDHHLSRVRSCRELVLLYTEDVDCIYIYIYTHTYVFHPILSYRVIMPIIFIHLTCLQLILICLLSLALTLAWFSD